MLWLINRLISCFKTKNDFDQYFNNILGCVMYKKTCTRCDQMIYLFNKKDYKMHVKFCKGSITKIISINSDVITN